MDEASRVDEFVNVYKAYKYLRRYRFDGDDDETKYVKYIYT